MDNMNELNLNEMEEISGGKGGYRTKPHNKAGFSIYRIQSGDTLSRIAGRYGTTASYLQSINRSVIPNINDITAGYYIYVPD